MLISINDIEDITRAAWRYEISLWVLKYFFTSERREETFRISKRPCRVLFIIYKINETLRTPWLVKRVVPDLWQLYAITNVINSFGWDINIKHDYLFIQHRHGNFQARKEPEYKPSSFFHGKNFTPTPVTLETIIEDILNPFLSVSHGLSGDEVSWALLINLG